MSSVIGRRASLGAMAGFVLAGAAAAAAEIPPATIRLAAVSAGYGKPFGLAVIGLVQAGNFIEDELKPARVRVTWMFPDGAGPAINEGIANGQIDFAAYGDLPNIIGRTGGLPTRVIASRGAEIIYVAVRNGVKAQTIGDLKGLRVTLQRGTILHQAFDRLLAENGLSERDVQLFDLKTQDQDAAIAAGDVDAVVGTVTLLNLRNQGLVRIIYTTRGKVTPDGFGAFVVSEDFARRYPATTQAVVRAYVKAARWGGEEKNRTAALAVWGRAGTPRDVLTESFHGVDLRSQLNPLLDGFYVATLKGEIAFALENKLIRQPVDVDAWLDRSYIQAALQDLSLRTYWAARALPHQAAGGP
jgi:sulfonate transport system substrate-binding protein